MWPGRVAEVIITKKTFVINKIPNSMDNQVIWGMVDSKNGYCLLCQEPHIFRQDCLKSVVCKGCGQLGHLKVDCSVRRRGNINSYGDKMLKDQALDEPSKERGPRLEPGNEVETESQFVDEPYEVRTSRKRKIDGSMVKPLSSCEDVQQEEALEENELGCESILSEGEPTRKKLKNSLIPTSPGNVSTAESLNSRKGRQESQPSQPTSSAQHEFQTSLSDSSKPSPKGKKSLQSLPVGHKYSIVCVHIETVKRSSSTETELTQIGCAVLNTNVEKEGDGFFRAIKPRGLDNLLDEYTISGDLLQALHMTREDGGNYLFRGRFEGDNDQSKPMVCCSEESALRDFLLHLSSLFKRNENVVLVAVDEESLAILVQKLEALTAKVGLRKNVVGFTCWKRALELTGGFNNDCGTELEEFFHKKKPLENCIRTNKFFNAKDVSEVLRFCLRHLSWQYTGRSGGHPFSCLVSRTCQRLETLPRHERVNIFSDSEEYVEFSNNFRPAFKTTMSVKRREVVHIDSESEEDQVVESPPIPEAILICSDSDEAMEEVLHFQGANAETVKRQTREGTSSKPEDVPDVITTPELVHTDNPDPKIATNSSWKPAISVGKYPRLASCPPSEVNIVDRLSSHNHVSVKSKKGEVSSRMGLPKYGPNQSKSLIENQLIKCPQCKSKLKPVNLKKHYNKIHGGQIVPSQKLTETSQHSSLERNPILNMKQNNISPKEGVKKKVLSTKKNNGNGSSLICVSSSSRSSTSEDRDSDLVSKLFEKEKLMKKLLKIASKERKKETFAGEEVKPKKKKKEESVAKPIPFKKKKNKATKKKKTEASVEEIPPKNKKEVSEYGRMVSKKKKTEMCVEVGIASKKEEISHREEIPSKKKKKGKYGSLISESTALLSKDNDPVVLSKFFENKKLMKILEIALKKEKKDMFVGREVGPDRKIEEVSGREAFLSKNKKKTADAAEGIDSKKKKELSDGGNTPSKKKKKKEFVGGETAPKKKKKTSADRHSLSEQKKTEVSVFEDTATKKREIEVSKREKVTSEKKKDEPSFGRNMKDKPPISSGPPQSDNVTPVYSQQQKINKRARFRPFNPSQHGPHTFNSNFQPFLPQYGPGFVSAPHPYYTTSQYGRYPYGAWCRPQWW